MRARPKDPLSSTLPFVTFGFKPCTTFSVLLLSSLCLLARRASQESIDFVISTGDNILPNGVANETDDRFRTTFENVYSSQSLDTDWYMTLGEADFLGNVTAQVHCFPPYNRLSYSLFDVAHVKPLVGLHGALRSVENARQELRALL